jgi:hypothetical protein
MKKVVVGIVAVAFTVSSGLQQGALYASAFHDGYVCHSDYHTFGHKVLTSGVSNQYFLIESSIFSASGGTMYGMAVSKAIGDWNKASSIVSVSQTYVTTDDVAVFRFVNSDLETGVLGYTTHYSTLVLPSRKIELTSDGALESDYAWTQIELDFAYMSSLSYDIYDMCGVAAHEFGHGIGLSHRNTNPSSIMCQTLYGRNVDTPQPLDVVTVAHLYG